MHSDPPCCERNPQEAIKHLVNSHQAGSECCDEQGCSSRGMPMRSDKTSDQEKRKSPNEDGNGMTERNPKLFCHIDLPGVPFGAFTDDRATAHSCEWPSIF